jgi:hypothetical protein
MINVFVGSTPSEWLPLKVLEYSIKKNTSTRVTVHSLGEAGVEIPLPKDASNRARTNFSFQRFLIPELMGNQGKAIYLDSDMIVFRDIKQLFDEDVEAVPYRTNAHDTSVILINCRLAKWKIKDIVESLDTKTSTYSSLFRDLQSQGPPIESYWNSHDRLLDGNAHGYSNKHTALLHYTTVRTQPWIAKGHPLEFLWFNILFEMLDREIVTFGDIEREITKGSLRPSINYQLEKRLKSSQNLPSSIRKLDKGFTSPHGMRVLHQGRSRIINKIKNRLHFMYGD